jgi:hypothetical protein
MALTKITTNIIADDAITADKIAAGAIDSTHITGISTSDVAEGTNLYYTSARFDTAFSGKSTTDLSEGTNLYYTDARFDTRLATKTTTDLAEGTNLYWTTARGDSNFSTNLAASDTDDLSEGSTNLYYTDARVGSYLTTNSYATESYVGTQIANLVDSAPTALDTLNELAAALGDDANFATTVNNSIATKWTQDNTKISNWDTAYGWGDHSVEGYLTGNQTITLTGDVSGSGTTSIAVTIADDSHNHVISNVDGLQATLDSKLALSGGTMTGTLTAAAQTWNGDITWNTGKNILVTGESSIDVSGAGYFQLWDGSNAAPFLKVDPGQQTEIGEAGTNGLKVFGPLTSTGLVTATNGLNVQNSTHNYLYLNSTAGYEQMVRFKNSLTSDWYAGIRTSAGIASTADFHIYSAALGNDVFALNTGGDALVNRNVLSEGIYNRTGTDGLKVGNFADANTDETGGSVVTWLRTGTWDNYLIKGSTSRGVFGTQFIGEHISDTKSWGVFSSGWDTEMQVNGDGRLYMKGPVGIGYTPTSTSDYKLRVNGTAYFSSTFQNPSIWVNDGSNYNGYNENIRLFDPVNSGPSVIAFGASGTSGTPRHSILSYSDTTNYGLDFRVGSTPYLRMRNGKNDFLTPLNVSGSATSGGILSAYNTANAPTMVLTQGSTGGYGPSLLIGQSTATQTVVDGNERPMVTLSGSYPVLNLNHTVTTNDNHGPTIQFTHNGYNSSRQWVIGSDGQGQRLDFGVSGGTAGSNTDLNPHRGIAGYGGTTIMRLFENGVLIGSTGTYPNEITSTAHELDVRGQALIQGTGTGTVPTLDIINTSASTFNHSMEVIAPNMGTGQTNIIVLGRASSTKNAGYLGWNYSGTPGSDSNYLSLGHWGNDNLLRLYGDGNLQLMSGTIDKVAYNKAFIVRSSGTSSSGSAIGFQQLTSEGWTGIFVDYTPNEGWGLYHDNPSNYFYITAESTTGNLGTSFTVPNRDSGSSTAYAKIRFDQNNGNINAGGAITANGNITAYASDRRLKENFRPIESAVDKVKALNGLYFDWKSELIDPLGFTPDSKQNDVGLVAQEVQAIMPQAVARAPFDTETISTRIKPGDKNAGNIEEHRSISGQDYLTVKYEKLIPLLVAAIKEQAQAIEALQSKIKELENGNH